MKKLLSLLLCGMIVVGLVGCSKPKNEVEDAEETNVSKIKEEHIAVLESAETYEEMDSSERTRAVEVIEDYWEELSEEEQLKYAERKEFILKTKDEAVAKWNEEKKTQMDSEYGHIKVAEDIELAQEEVKTEIINLLNETSFGQCEVSIGNSNFHASANVKFGDDLTLSDVKKGELTAISRKIFDCFTEAGLARTETSTKKITITYKIEGESFNSNWTLGESPEDDWNN